MAELRHLVTDETGKIFYITGITNAVVPATIELYEEINFDLNLVSTTNIYLDDYAWYSYMVSGVSIRSDIGTAGVSFQINTTNITGLSTLTATNSRSQYYSTALNLVNIGDYLQIVINGTPTATRLLGSVKIIRT